MIQIKGNDDIGHTYIISRFDQVFIIDPASEYLKILELIKNKTLSGIILTHAHSDHINLIGYFDCPIYIHERDYDLLFLNKYNGYNDKKAPFDKNKLKIIKISKEKEFLSIADKKVTLLHTPGHTKGSISIIYDKHIFTGDLLFENDIGRYDLYSGNYLDLKHSILKILNDKENNNLIICPGHDNLSTVKKEKKYNQFYLKFKK